MLQCPHLTLTKVSVYKPYICLDEIEVSANAGLLAGSPLILSPVDLSLAAIQMKGK